MFFLNVLTGGNGLNTKLSVCLSLVFRLLGFLERLRNLREVIPAFYHKDQLFGLTL